MADMEEMIKEEVNRISSLQERVVFKDIVEQIFLSLYETNQEMYQALEQRVMDDLSFDINRYRICIGIVEREFLDRSHHLLAPIIEKDLMEKRPDVRQLEEQLQTKGRCHIKTLFMECDFMQIQRLLQKERIGGSIRTDKDSYPAEFVLERNQSYLEEIARLYEVFTGNGVSWQTVNAPYLYKFVDVYLISDLPALSEKEVVTAIEPDLEEFKEWAHENFIPLWNIKKLILDSVGFPVPCEDHKSFEHVISIREYGNEHVYLIDDSEHIISVRQMENRLLVMGNEPEAKKWQVYMIRSGHNRKFDRFTFPVMTNERKDGFVERFFKRQGMNVKTKAELVRFIRGFGLEEYVELDSYELTDRKKDIPETYSMNSFILNEIRDNEYRKCLLLKFRGKEKNTFMLRDIMSFLVSEVQMLYPEYLCEGELL
ncbi:MAG: hypothetical protein HDR71_04065 [Lachnospiraceae bacterium]|nr:hypothetical protein [Lachnospiraceae bacterium]